MSIRYKYLLLFPLTALVPVFVFYIVTSRYISSALLNIERNRIAREAQTLNLALATTGTALESEATSLSRWSEAYNDITLGHTPTLGQADSRLSLVQTARLMALVDNGGAIRFKKGQWSDGDVQRLWKKVARTSEGKPKYSLERIAGGLALIGSAPLLNESGTGPSHGQFILARRIDGGVALDWQSLLQSGLTIYVDGQPIAVPENTRTPDSIREPEWTDMMSSFAKGERMVSVGKEESLRLTLFGPLRNKMGDIVGAFRLAASAEDLAPVKVNLDRASILIFAVVAVFATVLASILSFYIVGRITSLDGAIKNLISGENLPKYSTPTFMMDELDELLVSFIRMKEELDNYLGQLIASEVKYKRVVNSSISGLFVYSKGAYQFDNPRFEAILGYALPELNQHDPLGYIHPDDVETFVENLVFQISRTRFEQADDIRVITKAGQQKTLNFRFEWIDYQGAPALLGHVVDVTEQRRLERQLFMAHKLESVGTLAGGVAHDFNNILGGIIGLAEMIEEQYGSDRRLLEITERILKLGTRASRMVKHLLTFARGEDVTREVINVEEVIMRALELFVLPKDLRISFSANFPEPKAHLLFNPIQFEQMIVNLLVNARDAMPEGGLVSIAVDRISNPAEPGDASWIEIRVSDTGVGIPPEDIDRIFDPFFTTKDFGKGTGLGLAVVYGAVESNEGMIRVESGKNEGTTFILAFPEATVEA